MNTAFRIFIFLILGIAFVVGPGAATQPDEKGEALFEIKCLPCHTIGRGDSVGPDLRGVTKNRDRDWLIRFIKSPGKMFDMGDPAATGLLEKFRGIRMPDSGLTDAEIAAVLSYLDRENIVQPETVSGPMSARTEPRLEGDAHTGLDLFTGSIQFEKGGPPCIACHSIAGIASLGGGTLGPDLTQTHDDYGGDELLSVLSTIPFPTMKPIYDEHPLSPEELDHLTAYMEQAGSKQLVDSIGQLSVMVGVVFLAIVGLTCLLWRGRLREVRKSLVEESRKGGGP